jgi:hypothetical protein
VVRLPATDIDAHLLRIKRRSVTIQNTMDVGTPLAAARESGTDSPFAALQRFGLTREVHRADRATLGITGQRDGRCQGRRDQRLLRDRAWLHGEGVMAWTRSATSSAHRELSSGSHGTSAKDTGSPVRDAATPGGTKEASGASPSLSRETAQSHGTATTAYGTAEPSRTLSAQHVEALEARALDPEVAVKLGVYTVLGKFAGKDGLAIPMVREGQVINHKYRGPNKQFAQDKDAPRSFWNEDVLRDHSLAPSKGLPPCRQRRPNS